MVEAATDTEIFLAYLDEVLCPKLRPGDVVVVDNLCSHKVQGVRERIQAAGAICSTCRPTRLTWNPIEKAWCKLKILLSSAKARTPEALDQAQVLDIQETVYKGKVRPYGKTKGSLTKVPIAEGKCRDASWPQTKQSLRRNHAQLRSPSGCQDVQQLHQIADCMKGGVAIRSSTAELRPYPRISTAIAL